VGLTHVYLEFQNRCIIKINRRPAVPPKIKLLGFRPNNLKSREDEYGFFEKNPLSKPKYSISLNSMIKFLI